MKQQEAKVLSWIDPFFAGTDNEYQIAEWVATAWDTMMAQRRTRIHLRGFHYWLQSTHYRWPDGTPYAQADPFKEWIKLLDAAQVARYLGVGEWKNLVDFKHPKACKCNSRCVGNVEAANFEGAIRCLKDCLESYTFKLTGRKE